MHQLPRPPPLTQSLRVPASPQQRPEAKGGGTGRHHTVAEPARHHIRKPLHRCLTRLGIGNQPGWREGGSRWSEEGQAQWAVVQSGSG